MQQYSEAMRTKADNNLGHASGTRSVYCSMRMPQCYWSTFERVESTPYFMGIAYDDALQAEGRN